MQEHVTCTVYGDRVAEFEVIFGSATVPIIGPITHRANLPGIGEADVYLLKLSAITPDQRQRLVAHIAERFSLPESEVEADLNAIGMPVLASDCIITVPAALAFSMMDDYADDDYSDDDYDDYDDESDDFDHALSMCSMGPDGYCGAAGSEYCDWQCPISHMDGFGTEEDEAHDHPLEP